MSAPRVMVIVAFTALMAQAGQAQYGAWQHSQYIILNTTATGADVSADISEFPLLVKLDASNFHFSQARKHGEDIRFSDIEGNPIDYEIECWDCANSEAEIWVKVPAIQGDTVGWGLDMYWGNPRARDKSNHYAVFEKRNGFICVFHMNSEYSRIFPCGRGNEFFETRNEKTIFKAIKTIEKGRRISATIINGLLFSCLDKSDRQCYTKKGRFCYPIRNAFTISWWGYNSLEGWAFFAYVFDHGELRYYKNGHELPFESPPYQLKSQKIDEVRIENVARPGEWIKLCWENKRDNQTLVRFQNIVITVEPKGATIHEGGAYTFSVEAFSAPVIHYQWYKGFDPITGAIASDLTVPSAHIGDQAAYSCMVSNAGDSLRSFTAYLEVIETDTTEQHPLIDSDNDGVPDAVEDALGSDKHDPASRPEDLANVNNWNNNSAINARRTYDFSGVPGYSNKDSIPLIIPPALLTTDYTVLLQLHEQIAGIPEPQFKPGYARLGRYLAVTTTLAPGRSTLVAVPFPYHGFAPLDFLQVMRWNGGEWEEVKIANITAEALYIRVDHASSNIYSVGKDTKNAVFAGDWSSATDLDQGLIYGGVYDALNAARNNPLIIEIWVTTGAYGLPGTDRSETFLLVPNVGIYGGFPKGGSYQKAGRDYMLNATVLHGVLSPTQQRVWNVVRGTSNATIDGFTIRDGLADQYDVADVSKFCGAGMFNTGVTNLNVVNCIFQDNLSFAKVTQDPGSCGGGMYNLNSAVTIERCVFKNNSAYRDGGGLCIHGQYDPLTKCMVRKCDFLANFAGNRAAGVCTRNTDAEFERCVFIDNAGPGHGGGFFNWAEGMDSRPALTQCTFTDNSAQYSYGAIGSAAATGYNGKVIVTKCILWNDWVSQLPNRVTNETYPDAAEVSYSDVKVQPGQFPNDLFPGTGNINADPLFRVAQPFAPVDLRLSYTPQKSPCIDNAVMPVDPAYPGNRPDMGAYEHAVVMPLGNSITLGMGSAVGGYPNTLSNLLPVDFRCIAETGAPIGNDDFHGIRGLFWEAATLGFDNKFFIPDIVLLLGGTNDLRQAADIPDNTGMALQSLNALILRIHEIAPKAIVFNGSIPPMKAGAYPQAPYDNTNATAPERTIRYNNSTAVNNVTDGGVKGLYIFDQPVSYAFFVDHFSRMIDDDISFDKIHPTETGYRKIAYCWYERMAEVLPWVK